MHRNELLNARVIDARTFESERERAVALAEVARIEQRLDAVSIDVGPVEASVQYVEAEVSVDYQVVVGRQVGGEAESVGGLFPCGHGGVGTTHCDQITHVVEQIAGLEISRAIRLSRSQVLMAPSVSCLLHSSVQKCEQGIGARRARRLAAERSASGRTRQQACRAASTSELSFAMTTLNSCRARSISPSMRKKLAASQATSGAVGSACRARSARRAGRDVSGNLICAGQVEPVVGVVGIEFDRRSKALDGGLGIAGDEGLVATESMAVVGVAGREAHGAFAAWIIRGRAAKYAGCKFFAGQKNIDECEKRETGKQLPTAPI